MEDIDEDGNEYAKARLIWRLEGALPKIRRNDGQSTAASQYLASADDYEVLDPREPLTGEIGIIKPKMAIDK